MYALPVEQCTAPLAPAPRQGLLEKLLLRASETPSMMSFQILSMTHNDCAHASCCVPPYFMSVSPQEIFCKVSYSVIIITLRHHHLPTINPPSQPRALLKGKPRWKSPAGSPALECRFIQSNLKYVASPTEKAFFLFKRMLTFELIYTTRT